MAGIYRLQGTVKNYDWGGFNFIPDLIKQVNDEKKPFAEYWMGTHPLGISEIEIANGKSEKLTSKVKSLRYLFKVLDVKDMLSIQVHPSREAARVEFERENREGVPLDSPRRSYKDDNHKPELMVALGDFWLLHGFKPGKELIGILENTVELKDLLEPFNKGGYRELYRYVMEMPQADVNTLLAPLLDRIVPLYQRNELSKSSEDFWAARAAVTFRQEDKIDRGIFSIYLFNLVHLAKGQAIFQDAGVPHAYLEGQNVELMANSDNVLRGGLTTKFIDVEELLKHVKCEATVPDILTGEEEDGWKVFHTPADDFELSMVSLEKGKEVTTNAGSTQVLLVTEGKISISEPSLALEKGHPAAVVFPGSACNLHALENAVIFRAAEPAKSVNK